MNNETHTQPLEHHPWPPFLPHGAKVLIMGTFPPGAHRWSMNFYYPNPTNDFWRIMGLLYFRDKNALWLPNEKRFDINAIKALCYTHGIAMNDTARTARRLMGNASDKFLEIVEPVALSQLLAQIPECRHVATTGEKAAAVLAHQTNTAIPKMGQNVVTDTGITIWRMPSTSRAYPLAIEKKAAFYASLLQSANCL